MPAGPGSENWRSSHLGQVHPGFHARPPDGSPADACRQGNDRGRSVSAWGFWGDILNCPYHCFGTACKDPALFRVSNQQFVHTSVDVAERNVEVIVWQQSLFTLELCLQHCLQRIKKRLHE